MFLIFVLLVIQVQYIVELLAADEIEYYNTEEPYVTTTKRPNTRKIIGGWKTDIKYYPYQVSLEDDNGHFCGGSIIHMEWIITAAHCLIMFEIFNPDDIMIRAGTSVATVGGVVYAVLSIHVHPTYDEDTDDYDYCLLFLKSQITFTEKIKPIRIPKRNDEIPSGVDVRVSGWGVSEADPLGSYDLRAVELQTVSRQSCQSAFRGTVITERMICAGYLEGGKDACQGDSGGPLVAGDILVGIVSWGGECGAEGYFGIYSKVSDQIDWILRTMRDTRKRLARRTIGKTCND